MQRYWKRPSAIWFRRVTDDTPTPPAFGTGTLMTAASRPVPEQKHRCCALFRRLRSPPNNGRRRSARPACPRAAAIGNTAPCRCGETLAGPPSAPAGAERVRIARTIIGARLRGRHRAEHQCDQDQRAPDHSRTLAIHAGNTARTVNYRRSYLARVGTANGRAVRTLNARP